MKPKPKINEFIDFEDSEEEESLVIQNGKIREEDKKILGDWDEKEEQLDLKLDDVGILLDEIKVISNDLKINLEIRDQ